MPILNSDQLAKLRQEVVRGMESVDFDKPTINAAFQAVEDAFENIRAQLNADINAATSPDTLPAPVKKRLVKFWLQQKAGRE